MQAMSRDAYIDIDGRTNQDDEHGCSSVAFAGSEGATDRVEGTTAWTQEVE